MKNNNSFISISSANERLYGVVLSLKSTFPNSFCFSVGNFVRDFDHSTVVALLVFSDAIYFDKYVNESLLDDFISDFVKSFL